MFNLKNKYRLFGLLAFFALNMEATYAQNKGVAPEVFLEFCKAKNVLEAEIVSSQLGWHKVSGSEFQDWKRAYEGSQHGKLSAVLWRKPSSGGEEQLAFWIFESANSHRACNYSTRNAEGYLEIFLKEFGETEIYKSGDDIIAAHLSLGKKQVSFSSVGKIASITIANY